MFFGISLALAAHILLVGVTALRVLSREYLSPVKRLAWFMVLAVLPFIGVAGYVLFGEARILNIKTKQSEIFNRIGKLEPDIIGDNDQLKGAVDPSYRAAFQYAQSMNGFGLTLGNRAELMPDDKTARRRMIEDIDAAKTSINIMYYIWLKDKTGTDTARALIRASQRGVDCKVMADALGSRKIVTSKLWKDMGDAGVNLSIALPLTKVIKTLFLSRIDLRNHRKITVIDSAITYCGSQNCADPDFRPKKKYAPWVDIMLRFEGPVVAQNQLLFASDWLLHEDAKLSSFAANIKPFKGGFPALVWGDGPTGRSSATPQLFATLINSTQENLVISTPYFVPEEIVLGALYAAAHRGINVTLIFPARNDSWIVRAASKSYYLELLEAGVNIFEYKGGLLHAKTLTIDGRLTMVGSTNIDLRSFDLNYENNILVYDKKLTQVVHARQMDYINSSCSVTLTGVETWSLPKRIWYNVIATIGPVL